MSSLEREREREREKERGWWNKGAFTLDVSDSSVESTNTMLAIDDLNLVIMKILC